MTASQIDILTEKIKLLEKEIEDLKQVTIFSDIQPYIEENESKFHKVKISTVGLTYLVKIGKPEILKQLMVRIAKDLHQDVDNIQLLNPINGKILDINEDLQKFIVKDDEFIRLDFQYANKTSGSCGHDHSHSHNDGDDEFDSDEDFTDDENFYNSCSCAHPH